MRPARTHALRAARGGTAWRREPVARKAAFAQRADPDVAMAVSAATGT